MLERKEGIINRVFIKPCQFLPALAPSLSLVSRNLSSSISGVLETVEMKPNSHQKLHPQPAGGQWGGRVGG